VLIQEDVPIVKSYDEIGTSGVALAHSDVLEFLKTVNKPIAKLIVTSPPYNIGKSYEKKMRFEDYLGWQKKVLIECKRILLPGGSLCWQVGNYVEVGEVFPLDAYFYEIIKNDLGMKLRNRIIWRFGHGLPNHNRFAGRYETILWFTLDDCYTFNLDVVRVPCKYPGKRHHKGVKKGMPSCDPRGKNPTDMWDPTYTWDPAPDWEGGVWDIPNVKANHPEKIGKHPCQFPIELAERLILALTNEGDLILDPFIGTGTSAIAAVLHNRKAIGIDKDEEYIKLSKERILQAMRGELKRRILGTPIYVPKGTEKVAKPPLEWLKK
jgi:DNA modification methylase